MSESQSIVENLSEDEVGTIILVDANDNPVGSMSLVERLTSDLDVDSEQLIHRTCSLHVFWNQDETGKERATSSSKVLLSCINCVDSNLQICNGYDSGSSKKSCWTSTIRATPQFGMDPSEVSIIRGRTLEEQLQSNIKGCRNALARVIESLETSESNGINFEHSNNLRTNNNSNFLKLLPPKTKWLFVGRLLNNKKQKSTVRTSTLIADVTDDNLAKCSTMEYIFVCYINTHNKVVHGGQLPEDEVDNKSNNAIEGKINDEATMTFLSDNEQLLMKWVSRSELSTYLGSTHQNDYQIDRKCRYILKNILSLHDDGATTQHNFWMEKYPLLLPESFRQNQIYTLQNDAALNETTVLPLLGDDSKKQGAYGKIITHKEPILSQLCHVDEVFAAISLLYISPLKSNLIVENDPDMAFCEEILVAVSRSFAAVIRQLPIKILKDVAIFYLVLRALDTVEDDMVAFETNDIKCQHLLTFHETALGDPLWSMDGVGHGDERRLLQKFPAVHRVFASLPKQSQEIISDITARMAAGMAEFVGKDLGQGTIDVPEYNRYCHFVAGLVGEGLSRLFASSSLEHESLAKELFLSDQMGLFLQKTNIIRDFLEDYVDKRAFWPQSIWKKYSATGELGYFCDVDHDEGVKKAALGCLNELVADALELIPDCLSYMACLKCTEVFRFCAIPQVMALSTLEKLYNNPMVFTGVVKIRKGLACKLMQKSSNISDLHEIFYTFSQRIHDRCKTETCEQDNPKVYRRTIAACEKAMELTYHATVLARRTRNIRRSSLVILATLIFFMWYNQKSLNHMLTALAIALSFFFLLEPWSKK